MSLTENIKKILKLDKINGKVHRLIIKKSDGENGIYDTVNLMNGLKEYLKNDIWIRTKALNILRNGKNDAFLNAGKIFNYFVDRIEYRPDINGVETLQTPKYTIKYKAGDCDDMSLLMACFCESVGIPVKFMILGRKGIGYSHIMAVMYYRNKLVYMDLTRKRFNYLDNRYDVTKII